MSIASENRNIEILFEDEMPGYRCLVTRQTEGAMNLQFESLASHKIITLPAPPHKLWNTPEKLQTMCEQIAGEFLLLCDEPSTPPEDAATRITRQLAEKLTATFHSMSSQKVNR